MIQTEDEAKQIAAKARAKARADRIRAEVPILEVLAEHGYEVDVEGGDREQQFRCDLHGSGQDNKPSARVYPANNSWWCFACSENRDAIKTTMVKSGLSFNDACRVLERKHGLPPLPWSDEDGPGHVHVQARTFRDEMAQDVQMPGATWATELERSHRLLDGLTLERDLPMAEVMAFWEVHDMVAHQVDKGDVSEAKGIQALTKVRETVLGRLGVVGGNKIDA